MTLPVSTLTAVVVRGRKTNRVKRVRAARPAPVVREPSYRKDETTRGRAYKVVAISVPLDELAAVDVAAERHRMARSHFLREAARFYAALLDTTAA